MTHKKIILELYRKGYQTPEIVRMANHTEQACDRYIKAYKNVEKLNRTMINEEIAIILGMGKSLVKEYIRILNEEGD
jgi:hypothetical protein